jgi:hypothetical protein
MLRLKQIVEDIDEVFGAGFAKKHPELVGALVTHHGLSDIALQLDRLGFDTTASHAGFGGLEGLTMAVRDLALATKESP